MRWHRGRGAPRAQAAVLPLCPPRRATRRAVQRAGAEPRVARPAPPPASARRRHRRRDGGRVRRRRQRLGGAAAAPAPERQLARARRAPVKQGLATRGALTAGHLTCAQRGGKTLCLKRQGLTPVPGHRGPARRCPSLRRGPWRAMRARSTTARRCRSGSSWWTGAASRPRTASAPGWPPPTPTSAAALPTWSRCAPPTRPRAATVTTRLHRGGRRLNSAGAQLATHPAWLGCRGVPPRCSRPCTRCCWGTGQRCAPSSCSTRRWAWTAARTTSTTSKRPSGSSCPRSRCRSGICCSQTAGASLLLVHGHRRGGAKGRCRLAGAVSALNPCARLPEDTQREVAPLVPRVPCRLVDMITPRTGQSFFTLTCGGGHAAGAQQQPEVQVRAGRQPRYGLGGPGAARQRAPRVPRRALAAARAGTVGQAHAL